MDEATDGIGCLRVGLFIAAGSLIFFLLCLALFWAEARQPAQPRSTASVRSP
jgi:hypothetical protein